MPSEPDPKAKAPESAKSSPTPEKPTPERRFIQRQIVQPLIQWAPLGGSGWVFASFLLKQEWAQVFLTFPVTVVTAVWAAYSKSFVERLAEVYAERGTQDANALVKGMESLNQAVQWQLSGFEDKYRNCQKLACQDDSPDGIKDDPHYGLFTPLLQEVFVPLRLSLEAVQAGHGFRPSDPEAAEACRILLIWDLLKQVRQKPVYRQVVIRAWGGYGKTTLLKHLAYTYGSRAYHKYRAPNLVPFLLYLPRCWKELTKEAPPNLPALLTDYHIPKLPKADALPSIPSGWAKGLLRRGDALVMFDGFDEVPTAERSAVSDWLSQQMRQYPESVFIITSRPTAYSHHYTAKRPTASFWVERFNQEQRQRFVEQWYLCQERYARGGRNTPDVEQRAKQNAASLLTQIQERPELEAIAGNALLLNMMARFHRDKQGAELPDRKTELYQDICELQLARRPKARGIDLLLSSLSERQEVLQSLALAMMKRANPNQAQPNPAQQNQIVPDSEESEQDFKQITKDALLALLTPALTERDPDVSASEFLAQIVYISELLVEKEGDLYEFSHLSFQEFLVAKEVGRLKQESLLYEYLAGDINANPWKATILFYADLVNPTKLIREAMQRQAWDFAYQIWRETRKQVKLSAPELRDLEALGQSLQTSRYRALEDYLKQGQWQEADNETYRLMITAVGKESGNYFTEEELLNFPCEDLLTIDGLWVKYSQGRFGFTVQKRIYVECGAKLDGKYPGDETWEKFGERVGWRNDEWIEPTYSNNPGDPRTPPGHLPRHLPFSRFFVFFGGSLVGSLLSHTDL